MTRGRDLAIAGVLGAAGVLFLGVWVVGGPSLASLAGIGDYRAREIAYLSAMRWQSLTVIPGVLALAGALALGSARMRRVARRLAAWAGGLEVRRVALGAMLVVFLLAAAYNERVLRGTPAVADGFNYYFQAKNFLAGQASAPVPPAAEYFRILFVMQYHGRWFGSSYPGYPALLALGLALGAPGLVSPLLAAVALWLAVRLALLEHGRREAGLVALLAMLSPFFVAVSSLFMAHGTALFSVMLAIYGYRRALRAERPGPWLWASAGGVLLGLCSRPQAILAVGLPFGLQGLWAVIRRHRALRWVVPFLVAGVLAAGVLGLYNMGTTGDPFDNPRYRVSPERRLGFGADVGVPNPWHPTPGHTLGRGLWNTGLNLSLLNADLLGWGGGFPLGLTLVLALIPVLWRERRRVDLLFFAGFLVNVLLYVGYYTPSPNFGPRYYYESIPFLLILVSRGILVLWDGARRAGHEALAAGIPLGLSLLVVQALVVHLPRHLVHYSASLPPVVQRGEIEGLDDLDRAIVLTDFEQFRSGVFLWNDPNLRGPVIFAAAPRDGDLSRLRAAFPDRPRIYRLIYDAARHEGRLAPVVE
jgi:hypothetical protein